MRDSQTVDKPFRVGVFNTVAQADRAVHRLLEAGFRKEELVIICSDKHKEALFEQEHLRTMLTGSAYTPEFIPAGAAVGAALGGVALAATAIATGGVGLVAVGASLVAGGALAGSFAGAMMTRGLDREVTNYCEQAVDLGKLLVAVEIHEKGKEVRLAEAERILTECGGDPVPLVEG